MTYLLLICAPENVQLTPEESAAMGPATEAGVAEMEDVGLEGGPLRPVRGTAVVRVRDGETLVSDGPFAETKEQIAGYDVIECSSMGEAVEVAARHPVAKVGTIEVRPFGPEGWWRSAQRRGPAGAPEYLMIHRADVPADLGPSADCTMPRSPAAPSLQSWSEETDARGVKPASRRPELPAAARTGRR